jgi:hypothetical protein
LLSRDQILEANDLETREVDCPEWGGSVLVRALSGRERDAWEASLVQMRGKQQVPQMGNVRAKLVVRCCVDENGERLFSDADVKALGREVGGAARPDLRRRLRDVRHQRQGHRGDGGKLRGRPERRFYFELARELGMTVAELLARISSRELTEWAVLYRIEAEEREAEEGAGR